MAKLGRRVKRTTEIDEKIEKALATGNTRRAACAFAGISEDTLARWIKSFADFAELVALAEARCEVHMTSMIYKAAQERDVTVTKTIQRGDAKITETVTKKEFDWKAALAWLERRRSEDWAARSKHELTGPDGGAIQLQFQDQLDRIYGKGEKREG
ncbi:MAG: hypothetical protein K1X67_07965 [Fimbriimonadaceae bacterium]|nr:hypothetical protein [Fimbriimonadaceae bacterium]